MKRTNAEIYALINEQKLEVLKGCPFIGDFYRKKYIILRVGEINNEEKYGRCLEWERSEC